MYERILVPVDGSGASDAAVEKAIDLASMSDAELHALYVIETKATYIITVGLSDEEIREHEEYGEGLVTDAVEKAADRGIDNAKGVIKKGKPASEIVTYAEEKGVDYIVMGKQGHGAIDKFIGSTADKVLRMSDIPVTVVVEE